jgi:hypothetical protein
VGFVHFKLGYTVDLGSVIVKMELRINVFTLAKAMIGLPSLSVPYSRDYWCAIDEYGK